jgi:hypothetical protein
VLASKRPRPGLPQPLGVTSAVSRHHRLDVGSHFSSRTTCGHNKHGAQRVGWQKYHYQLDIRSCSDQWRIPSSVYIVGGEVVAGDLTQIIAMTPNPHVWAFQAGQKSDNSGDS